MDLLVSYSIQSNPILISGFIDRFGTVGVLAAIGIAMYALLQCYFGYVIFRVILVIQGIINGLGVGAIIGNLISMASGSMEEGMAIVLISALVCGIVGGIMAHFLYKFGVFCYFFFVFALIGLVIGGLISSSGSPNPAAIYITMAVMGLIGGILGVILERYIIIWCTGIVYGLVAGIAIGLVTAFWLGITLALVFIVTGIIVQTHMTKKKKAAQTAGAPQQNIYAQNGQFPQGQQYQQMPYQGQPMNRQPIYQQAPQQPQYQPAAPQHTCVKCGAPLDADAVFCGLCGARQDSAPMSAPAAEQPVEDLSESETIMFTPSSEPVYDSPSENVASVDNNAAPEAPMFCPSCGARLEIPGALFCEACGSRIE